MYVYWKVTPDHIIFDAGSLADGYDVEIRSLATPESRQRWIEHIEEKTWASDAAKAEFARIVESLT